MNPLDPSAEYLYRGTTLGWLGTPSNQSIPMTCTSTDPLIATLFALEIFFRGPAVVQFALRTSVERFIGDPNHIDAEERAVNLRMKPSDFAYHVIHFIGVDDAREILVGMGFGEIPYHIRGLDVLSDELEITEREGHRLSREQMQHFNRSAFEINP